MTVGYYLWHPERTLIISLHFYNTLLTTLLSIGYISIYSFSREYSDQMNWKFYYVSEWKERNIVTKARDPVFLGKSCGGETR